MWRVPYRCFAGLFWKEKFVSCLSRLRLDRETKYFPVCACVRACARTCACVALLITYLSSQNIYIYTLGLRTKRESDNELNATYMCIPLSVTYDSCLFVGWETPTTVTSEYPPSITLQALVQGRDTFHTWGRMPWQLCAAVCLEQKCVWRALGKWRFQDRLPRDFLSFYSVPTGEFGDGILIYVTITSPHLFSLPYAKQPSSNLIRRNNISSFTVPTHKTLHDSRVL